MQRYSIDFSQAPRLPDLIKDEIDAYFKEKRPPCSFLKAVLSNDLRGSYARADGANVKIIQDLVEFLYFAARVPSDAFGSEEAVDSWMRN